MSINHPDLRAAGGSKFFAGHTEPNFGTLRGSCSHRKTDESRPLWSTFTAMNNEQDLDEARRAAQQFEWRVIAILIVVTIVGFWAFFAYEDHKLANETCTERKVRESKELGIPMMYDPRTGLAPGCAD